MTHWLEGPVLFLDVDGVLNSLDYVKRGGSLNCGKDGLDQEAVKRLQSIVDATGCALVLSSTWRLIHSLADMRGKLIKAGMRSPVPLRDKTPSLNHVKDIDTGIIIARKRGDEVKQWIEDRAYTGRYVCLDDDADFLDDQPLVQTSFSTGLTDDHVARCIDILRARMETPADECMAKVRQHFDERRAVETAVEYGDCPECRAGTGHGGKRIHLAGCPAANR